MSLISTQSGDHSNYLNPGLATIEGLPKNGMVGWWAMHGGDPTTPAKVPLKNLFLWSEDLTNGVYAHDVTTDSATQFTASVQNQFIHQSVTTLDAVSYTFAVKLSVASGSYTLNWRHQNSADGNHGANFGIDATPTVYAVTFAGRSGGGGVDIGLRDPNASGFVQVTATELIVAPGEFTASEMAAFYETGAASTDQQTIPDKSGSGNDAVRGANSGAATDDPTYTVTRANLLAAASESDLTHAAWAAGADLTVNDSNTITADDATANAFIRQSVVPLTSATLWTMRVVVSVNVGTPWLKAGASDYAAHGYQGWFNLATGVVGSSSAAGSASFSSSSITALGGGEYAIVVTGVPFSATAKLFFQLVDGDSSSNATATDSIDISQIQVEVGDSADDGIPSDFTTASTWGVPGLDFDGTDDFVTAPAISVNTQSWTALVVAKVSTTSGHRTILGGSTTPRYSLKSTGGQALFWGGQGDAEKLGDILAVDIETWQIFAVTLSTSAVTFYLNGSANGSEAAYTSGSASNALTIGQGIGSDSDFDGQIAHALVYSRALSTGEVSLVSTRLSQYMWDYRGVTILGSGVDYDVDPTNFP